MIIVGSKSNSSINYNVAEQINKEEVYDIRKLNVPMYTKELEESDGIPDDIQNLFDKIKENNELIIFTPEYNGYFSGFFKNIIDWLSRIERHFLPKTVYVICVTPGKLGGKSVLKAAENSFPFFGVENIKVLPIGSYYQNIDENGILNEETKLLINNFLKKN